MPKGFQSRSSRFTKVCILGLAILVVFLISGDAIRPVESQSLGAEDQAKAAAASMAVTIDAEPVMVTAGEAVADSIIGRVRSGEGALEGTDAAVVTVDGGSGATKNEITLTDLRISGSGVVTAYIAAGASAASDSFTLAVTDRLGSTSSATLRVLIAPNGCPGKSLWGQQAHPTASDGATNDFFGTSISISGDTAIIGAPSADEQGGADAGAAYVFIRSGTVWTQQQKLTASDGAINDEFGFSVSISGDTAVIGAYLDDVPSGGNAGSAYIFTRSGTVWTQQQRLTASDGAVGDLFGGSVSISGDTTIVGARGADTAGGASAGSAYVFTRSGTVWSQQQKLTASDALASDEFGSSISISGDTAVVGAQLGDMPSGVDAGSAYVFTRSGSVWTQQQKLTASDGLANDHFGISISISGDTAVVGALLDDTSIGADAGSAYVFTRTGSVWTQQQKLTASDGVGGDYFGLSVSISADTAIVGAYTEFYTGSAYVFTRSGTVWTEQQQLTSADGSFEDAFGRSVGISGDTVVVGAFNDDTAGGFDAGSAYVFTQSCIPTIAAVPVMRTAGAGVLNSTIANVNDGEQVPNTLAVIVNGGAGATVNGVTVSNISISPAGVVTADVAAAAGAADAAFTLTVSDNTGLSSRATLSVIVLSQCPATGTWMQQAHPTASDGSDSDQFGISVAISGDTAIVGANLDDPAGTDSGSAYVFIRSGTLWTQQQILTPTAGAAGDDFGVSVAISGDTAIVGAELADTAGGTDAGAAYIFIRSGTVWTQQQQLTAADGALEDQFGLSVAISGDTVVVGSYGDDTANGISTGSAYIFTRSGVTWTLQQQITASDGSAGDLFGSSIAISGDTVIVGAYHDDANAGSAYIFTRSGTIWVEQQRLTASDGAASDLFGGAVSISGETAIVGALGDDTAAGTNAGSAYVYTRTGTLWTQQQKLTSSDAAGDDRFGYSVSISGDTVIVGASTDDTGSGPNVGSAYVFTRSGSLWTQQQKLTASDAATEDRFGISVANSADTVVVGAFLDDVGIAGDSGSVYVFNKNCPAASPTPTGPSISGAITYGNAIGSPVPPRFVKTVSLSSTAGSPAVGPVITGTPGTYSLSGFGAGSYTIKPTKPGGVNGAITSNDAARVAQGVVSAPGFVSQNQRFAADTSGNGGVTSNDAALIARFAAGLTGTGNVGQWKFFVTGAPSPLPTTPQTYDDSRTYASVSSNLTGEDFVGILVGEVSGNWNPATHPRPVNSGQWTVDSEDGGERGKPITVTVQPVVTAADKEVVVPVSVQGVADREIISYEFDLRYDPAVIQPQVEPVDVAGTVSRGLMVVANPYEPGLLRVVVYGAMPIDGDGVLLNLRFTAVGGAGSISPLVWERIMFNEGESQVTVADGQVEISY